MPPSRIFRWSVLLSLVLAVILVPFVLYEEKILAWTSAYVGTDHGRGTAAGVLGGLLALDIVLPVPSSIISTAAGFLLGFWSGAGVSWAGMTAGCLFGYWLGAKAARRPVQRLVGQQELLRVSEGARKYGDWVIVAFRAVPVLAEASVFFAGLTRMAPRRFLLLTGLSNLGISTAYAMVGAFSVRVESFLLAFAGAIALPLAAMLLERRKVGGRKNGV